MRQYWPVTLSDPQWSSVTFSDPLPQAVFVVCRLMWFMTDIKSVPSNSKTKTLHEVQHVVDMISKSIWFVIVQFSLFYMGFISASSYQSFVLLIWNIPWSVWNEPQTVIFSMGSLVSSFCYGTDSNRIPSKGPLYWPFSHLLEIRHHRRTGLPAKRQHSKTKWIRVSTTCVTHSPNRTCLLGHNVCLMSSRP